MPQRLLNTFYPWIKQDNYLTGWASFIEWKNIDWLKEWIGITLWPKVNKAILTSWAMRGINWEQLWTVDLNRTIVWGDNWEIYKLNSDTPVHTITWTNIISIVWLWNNYIIFTKANFNTVWVDIYKISETDLQTNNFTSLASPLLTWQIFNTWVPPTLVTGSSEMYIWTQWAVAVFDWTSITSSFTVPDDYITWLSLQGSTVAIYSISWNTYFWDWAATLESGRWNLWARTEKVVNLSGQDYVTCEDWQLRASSYTQSQRIFKPNKSYRLENNSILSTKLDFSLEDPDQNKTSISALDDLYFYGRDTIKWIYKYWNLFPWLSNGIHKIITQNHEGTQIDIIYDMFFYERTDRKLYFSYKAWTTYWVDYIDLDSLETCTSWYWVTEVFTGWTAFNKELDVIRMSVSNVDENNTVSLYYRVNNQDWVLIRTINSVTDDIYYRENISTESTWESFKDFIDVQFKVELNWEWTDTPPTLNELLWSYTITKA